jgi:hypothetical protein
MSGPSGNFPFVKLREELISDLSLNLAKFAISFSIYNFIVWSIDWFRQDEVYLGPVLWALVPQLFCSFMLIKLVRGKDEFRTIFLTTVLLPIAWLATIVTNGLDLLFPSETLPWDFTSSLLEAMGFPILEISLGSTAPFFGLMHSNAGDLNKATDWYFDGGIQLSWLFLNIVSAILILLLTLRLYQNRYDISRLWNS